MHDQDVLGRCPDVTRTPALTWRRFWVALLAGAAIMTVASLMILSQPDRGYRAGFDAATADWADARPAVAGGSAQPICLELYRRSQGTPLEPKYDYAGFLAGCTEALAGLTGR